MKWVIRWYLMCAIIIWNTLMVLKLCYVKIFGTTKLFPDIDLSK